MEIKVIIWSYTQDGLRKVNSVIKKPTLESALDFMNMYIPTSEDSGLTIEVNGRTYDEWIFDIEGLFE